LTKTNYAELCELQYKYADDGLLVLAVPCNQFGGQEPGRASEIKRFAADRCPSGLTLLEKANVNGDDALPLYTWLKRKQSRFPVNDVIWNFEKFLVDRGGNPVARFGPQKSPKSLEEKIVKLLDQ